MATETHTTPAPHASERYNLEAVNNARVPLGKRALTKDECDKALVARPKAEEPPKADPKSTEPPPPAPFVETDAQYLVGLPYNYVPPALDEGRMRTTPPTPPRA